MRLCSREASAAHAILWPGSAANAAVGRKLGLDSSSVESRKRRRVGGRRKPSRSSAGQLSADGHGCGRRGCHYSVQLANRPTRLTSTLSLLPGSLDQSTPLSQNREESFSSSKRKMLRGGRAAQYGARRGRERTHISPWHEPPPCTISGSYLATISGIGGACERGE